MKASAGVIDPPFPSQAVAQEDEPGGRRTPPSAWTLARTMVTVVFCGSGLVTLVSVWETESSGLIVLAAVLLAVLLGIQLSHFSRPGTELRSTRSYVLLGVLACLAYVPILAFGEIWTSLVTFLAGCVLLVLPPVAAWTSFAAISASAAGIYLALHESAIAVTYGLVDTIVSGFVVYLLTRLANLVAELHAARDELAQLAVAEERLRFARDLHDLLGLSLSAVTLKGELTHRLLSRYPERAKQELTEILDISRRALADVRSVASGYRELSLDREAQSAESVLQASGVDVRMELDYTDLPVHIRTVLGMMLREAVTNVLRHSKAEHCTITIRQTANTTFLDVLNDGVVEQLTARDPDSGSGIRNLSDRVAALQGEVTTTLLPDGRFRLRAQIPLNARPAPRDDGGTPARDRRRVPSFEAMTRLPFNTRMATLLVAVVFVGECTGAIIHLGVVVTGWQFASGAGYVIALLALQLGYFSRASVRLHSTLSYVLLFVQACLIYLPLIQLGKNWVSLPGWLGASALMVLRPTAGWTVFAASIGSVIWVHVVGTGQSTDIAFNAAATLITGLLVFGLTSITRLLTELEAIRKQLATMAVAEERLRFARDLHDLLGLSLSAITLKCELTKRLLAAYPQQAAEELTEILTLARQALADVRSVASGYRELSFDKESVSAQSVLTAADVVVRMDLEYDELPVRVRTVLAVVLREGVTNVLRHSTARNCDIVLRQAPDGVSLAIVNDGVATAPDNGHPRVGGHGSGIRNLSERVTKLGGDLDCGEDPDGHYRLKVSLPI